MTLIRRIRDRAGAWCGPRTSAALSTRGSAAINACRRHVAGHALPDAAFCGLPRCSSDLGAAEGGMMWNPCMRHVHAPGVGHRRGWAAPKYIASQRWRNRRQSPCCRFSHVGIAERAQECFGRIRRNRRAHSLSSRGTTAGGRHSGPVTITLLTRAGFCGMHDACRLACDSFARKRFRGLRARSGREA